MCSIWAQASDSYIILAAKIVLYFYPPKVRRYSVPEYNCEGSSLSYQEEDFLIGFLF
jgi:hypothetical protein